MSKASSSKRKPEVLDLADSEHDENSNISEDDEDEDFTPSISSKKKKRASISPSSSSSSSKSKQTPPSFTEVELESEDEKTLMRRLERKNVTCSSVRARIKRFLATKEITQTEFLKQINCNSNSYQRFLKLKGEWNGTQNGVYWGALKFFDRRERQKEAEKESTKAAKQAEREALKALPKEERKRRKLESSSTTPTSSSSSSSTTSAKGRKAEMSAYLQSIADYELPRSFFHKSNPDSFPVYDDCDVIRKKSLEFIASQGISTAEFLRVIGNVNSKSWRDFMQYHGKGMGAANNAYPKAYLFLEKYRLKEGLPKSKLRLDNEKSRRGGFELVHADRRMWMAPGETLPSKYYELI